MWDQRGRKRSMKRKRRRQKSEKGGHLGRSGCSLGRSESWGAFLCSGIFLSSLQQHYEGATVATLIFQIMKQRHEEAKWPQGHIAGTMVKQTLSHPAWTSTVSFPCSEALEALSPITCVFKPLGVL